MGPIYKYFLVVRSYRVIQFIGPSKIPMHFPYSFLLFWHEAEHNTHKQNKSFKSFSTLVFPWSPVIDPSFQDMDAKSLGLDKVLQFSLWLWPTASLFPFPSGPSHLFFWFVQLMCTAYHTLVAFSAYWYEGEEIEAKI